MESESEILQVCELAEARAREVMHVSERLLREASELIQRTSRRIADTKAILSVPAASEMSGAELREHHLKVQAANGGCPVRNQGALAQRAATDG
jgi:hypothetical protein